MQHLNRFKIRHSVFDIDKRPRQMLTESIHTHLIAQLQQGCPLAFDCLYRHYSRELLRNIHYQVKDLDLAKDITQEVFLTLWKKRESVDPYRPLKHYLNVVAKYLIINHYRKTAGHQKMTDKVLMQAVDFHSHTEEALHYKETKAIIDGAIATLTPHQQAIYKKCRLEGQTHQEIAQELGISKSTVNNQMVKANSKVIAFLEKYEPR
jgi:RNA polymerase sigma-70 factor (family 1)